MERSFRPRRLRHNPLIRDLVAETPLNLKGMIQPYFVTDGSGVREEIAGMPNIHRESVDRLVETIAADLNLGINKIMLFGVTERKDQLASTAWDEKNPVIRACKELKQRFAESLFISADVCLCAYTDTGHCGITIDGEIDNDKSVAILSRMAVALAKAGCDCVGPSDMMDGRIAAIRLALEKEGHSNELILAYTAKYASTYYGPFREAAHSAPGKGDRKGYQMDFRNRREALKELELDEAEGADIVMVKPALAYLDIIADFAANTSLPIAAYNVSGEYTAVKLMAQAGMADEKTMTLENLTAITRAGASIILTYHLRDILKHGWHL
ncbi:MAG: porphobilinogen synthase [candidate division Zixibacteria bacterium]|nr:porphobilinogen synthase [candidate division Zixibacteria bacterium]